MITINGRFLTQETTGVQRYARELLTTLDRLITTGGIEPVPVTVLTPQTNAIMPAWSSLQIRPCGRLRGQLWEQIDLPRHAHGTLLFTPCGGAPVIQRPHLIAIHDAAPFSTPNAYSPAYRNYYRALQRILAHTAAQVITVSEFSRQELVRALNLPPERIAVTWLSGQHILCIESDPRVLDRHRLSPGQYVLGVGSRNPNKNLAGLIAAARRLGDPEIPVVIAGGAYRSVFSDSGTGSGRIVDLCVVTDAELRALYENAGCFVFPSFYEGFGLPPLEAMTLGCPVIVARSASLPEVFGDAAVYCDPHSPSDIADRIERVMQGEHPDRTHLQAYASQFTWDRCARQTWSILLNAIRRTGKG